MLLTNKEEFQFFFIKLKSIFHRISQESLSLKQSWKLLWTNAGLTLLED